MESLENRIRVTSPKPFNRFFVVIGEGVAEKLLNNKCEK